MSGIEIVVSVEGDQVWSGDNIDTKTSYLGEEVEWGARFRHDGIFKTMDTGHVLIDMADKHINDIELDQTPRISARELEENNRREEESNIIYHAGPPTASGHQINSRPIRPP